MGVGEEKGTNRHSSPGRLPGDYDRCCGLCGLSYRLEVDNIELTLLFT